ncbi:MAG: hypothetical protein ACE5JB_04465 [bacterium]
MPNVIYKLIDIEKLKLSDKKNGSKKDSSVATTTISSFITTFRPSNLSVLDFGIACGIIWAILVSIFTLMAFNGRALLFVNYFETIYPGYNISNFPTAIEILLNIGIGILMGFACGFLFGVYVALIYNYMIGPAINSVKVKGEIPHGKPMVLINKENKQHLQRIKEPYTVAVLANPFIENSSSDSSKFTKDPILSEPEFFKAKVNLIMTSLANNYVLQPFLHKMRFIVIFDPAMGNFTQKQEQEVRALCREYPYDMVIEPVQARVVNYLKSNYKLGRVDIVFAVTASSTHIRSSARYTEDDDTGEAESFVFRTGVEAPSLTGYYRPRAKIPGMIAYSAWDDRLKTPIHEFAHAMSSTKNGLIDDEYYDDLFYDTTKTIVINKRHATEEMDINRDKIIQPIELPPIFAQYIENYKIREFPTDKLRSASYFWRSFVPARSNAYIPCTMDRSDEFHQFDLLLHYFITRRLAAKVG